MNTTAQNTTTPAQPEDNLTVEGLLQGAPILNNPDLQRLLQNDTVRSTVVDPLAEATEGQRQQLNQFAAPVLQPLQQAGSAIEGIMDTVGGAIAGVISIFPEPVQNFMIGLVNRIPLLPSVVKNPIINNIRENLQEANNRTTAETPPATGVTPTQQQQTAASEHDVPVAQPVSPVPTPPVEQATAPEQGQVRG